MRWQALRRNSEGGFSLIELMIAITVLTVAVLSTFITQLSSHNLLRTSRETNMAVADAHAAMEALLLVTPISSLPVAGSTYASGQPIASFNGLHLTNERVVASYPNYVPGGVVPDPLQIVIEVTWNDFGGRPRRIRIASMKTQ
jgi:prepilin-type N-terminal cleavage/methylation domain-containing protein